MHAVFASGHVTISHCIGSAYLYADCCRTEKRRNFIVLLPHKFRSPSGKGSRLASGLEVHSIAPSKWLIQGNNLSLILWLFSNRSYTINNASCGCFQFYIYIKFFCFILFMSPCLHKLFIGFLVASSLAGSSVHSLFRRCFPFSSFLPRRIVMDSYHAPKRGEKARNVALSYRRLRSNSIFWQLASLFQLIWVHEEEGNEQLDQEKRIPLR